MPAALSVAIQRLSVLRSNLQANFAMRLHWQGLRHFTTWFLPVPCYVWFSPLDLFPSSGRP